MTALHVLPQAAGGAEYPCSTQPEVFFQDGNPLSVMEAKELCGTCPVRTACLDGAIKRREPWGVWGGALFENGRVVRYKRPPGRPRLNPSALSGGAGIPRRAS